MAKHVKLTKARQADSLKFGKRAGFCLLLAVFMLLFLYISALAQEETADYWIKNGFKQKWSGSFEEANQSFGKALEIYDKMIEANPKDISAWNNRSLLLINLGKTIEAINTTDRAIENNSNNPDFWNMKGFAIIKIIERAPSSSAVSYSESLQAFDKALELDANNTEAWRGKGLAFSSMERYDEALKALDRAVEIDPNNAQAWQDRGILLLDMNRPEVAVSSLDRALAINPNDIDSLTAKAQALSALGRYDEATGIFDRAMQMDFTEPVRQVEQSKGNDKSKRNVPLVLGGNSSAWSDTFESGNAQNEEELQI